VGNHPSQPQPSSAPAGADADAALVAAAVAGDRQAFAALVERHQARILAFLERLTGCREQARDLAQETFVSAYRKLATFEQRSAFSTWLYRIACNHVAAAGRRRRPRRGGSSVPVPVPVRPRRDDRAGVQRRRRRGGESARG